VTASVYNLVNSATANSSILIVSASTVSGGGGTVAPSSIAIAVKNNGGSTIACSGASCTLTFGPGTVSVAPAGATLSGTGWTASLSAGTPTFIFDGTLSPGAQTAFVFSGYTGGSFASMPARSASVTLTALFGSTDAQVVVPSQ